MLGNALFLRVIWEAAGYYIGAAEAKLQQKLTQQKLLP